jgi:hypothetical protein
MAVGLDATNVGFVRLTSSPSLGDIPGRQVAGGDDRSAAGQDDGRHAVAAAQVQNRLVADIAEAGEGRPNPGFVVEIIRIAETEPVRLGCERDSPGAGLAVVELLFAAQAVRRGHGWPPCTKNAPAS